MTTEEIQKRIDEITGQMGDYEKAHAWEDDLYRDFVKYVASVAPHSLGQKAKLVLTTADIDFPRHCA